MVNNINSKTVSELWQLAYADTREYVREYFLTHAYLSGYQWMEWDPQELELHSMPDDNDRIQATMNHMRANMRTIIAQMTQRFLTFEVPPSGYDDATIRAARTSEALLADLKEDHDWETLREANVIATLKGGTSAISVDWSNVNETTLETVLTVSEFVVEPGSRDGPRARWWIKQQLFPPQEVQAMFKEHFPDNPPEADGKVGSASEYEYRERRAEMTRVFTYYERPNPLTPEGKIVVEINGKRVQEGVWPFPWKHRLNIAISRETLVEYQAFGESILWDVRSPQTALNAAWSGYLEHMRESSNHRLIIDDSWVDAIDGLNDRAGAPLQGPVAKGAPSYLKAPTIPQGMMDGIELLKREIDTLMGVHDVSRGQAPANIESGYGLSILAEKDSSPVGRLIKESAKVWSQVGWMVLELHQTGVKKERETSIHDGAAPSVRKWKGSDIMGQTRAMVPLEAILPRSQAAQQQWAEKAVEMGLINGEDPLAVMRFAKLADMPDQRGIVNATLPDAAKATRENEAVKLDEVPEPAVFDNHGIHIEVHNDFRKTIAYEQMTPQQREDLDNHVQVHQNFAQEALAEQRLGSFVDPALPNSPRADGAPPLPELPPEAVPGGAPGPVDVPAEPPVDPLTATNDIMQALNQL
jgi:hypothetical protein